MEDYEFGTMDSYGETDSVSIFTTNSNYLTKKEKREKKVYDTKRGHHLIFRYTQKADGSTKRMPVELYTTRPTLDARIRNAATGFYEPDAFVGRVTEDAFFKVQICTGELGKDAPSNLLFYDSPEQYERHMFTELDVDTKRAWYERVNLPVPPPKPLKEDCAIEV